MMMMVDYCCYPSRERERERETTDDGGGGGPPKDYFLTKTRFVAIQLID